MIVILGTSFVMVLCDAVGYIAYGDRPGTGWLGLQPHLSIDDIEFLIGFAVFAAYMSLISVFIPVLMAFSVAILWLYQSRHVYFVVVLPSFVLATFWLFVASGWYIAIDPVFALVGAALSLVFCAVIASKKGVSIGRFRTQAFTVSGS
ncbi:MAG: hypothetical protein JOZ38_08940 [Candidatus Eremiobacteraeota bacterium]|nr:hypothetical protein [Candidatus Eremiobacteraeota bacterium]